MTTNKVFQNNVHIGSKEEQNLVESNIIEMIQMSGYNCFYIPRKMISSDYLFHEAPADTFEGSHEIEMYVNNVSDFGGQGDLMSKFGFQIDDTIEFVVSRKRFHDETNMEKPLEGDLIYFPLSQHIFEIDFVEDEPGEVASVQQFFSLGRLYTYAFKCTLFSPSYEDFDTGIEEVDTQLDGDTYTPNYGNNDEINNEANENLDWEETNPFGGRTTE